MAEEFEKPAVLRQWEKLQAAENRMVAVAQQAKKLTMDHAKSAMDKAVKILQNCRYGDHKKVQSGAGFQCPWCETNFDQAQQIVGSESVTIVGTLSKGIPVVIGGCEATQLTNQLVSKFERDMLIAYKADVVDRIGNEDQVVRMGKCTEWATSHTPKEVLLSKQATEMGAAEDETKLHSLFIEACRNVVLGRPIDTKILDDPTWKARLEAYMDKVGLPKTTKIFRKV